MTTLTKQEMSMALAADTRNAMPEGELSAHELDGVNGGALIGMEMMFVATILVLGLMGGLNR